MGKVRETGKNGDRLEDLTGRIASIQRFCVHDGPGIRTTVFFRGCPLTCPWCHNPEMLDGGPGVWILPGRCCGCGACLEVCPRPPERPAVDPRHCRDCYECVTACPTGARQARQRTVTVAGLMDELLPDQPFFDESGGGVTFSGGEPFGQPEFLLKILQACRRRGVHTAVDTSGHVSQPDLLAALPWTDLFLFDLKLIDEERHREQTGIPAGEIVANLRRLDAEGAAVWVRVPLIPGVNDDDENLDALGELVGELKSTHRLHLLPYHRAGAEKRRWLGPVAGEPAAYPAPEEQSLAAAAERLSRHGLDVHLGG